jgi:hypothetical protein
MAGRLTEARINVKGFTSSGGGRKRKAEMLNKGRQEIRMHGNRTPFGRHRFR